MLDKLLNQIRALIVWGIDEIVTRIQGVKGFFNWWIMALLAIVCAPLSWIITAAITLLSWVESRLQNVKSLIEASNGYDASAAWSQMSSFLATADLFFPVALTVSCITALSSLSLLLFTIRFAMRMIPFMR